jgi:uncharacterized repeat protein (TIGR03809 family)
MTHRLGVAGGHDLVARWCALAEQRLEYLTEMFESGRWRRYYSELTFLENIREAKVAVETWRGLSAPASIHGLSAVALSMSEPKQAPRHSRIELEAAPPAAAPEPIEVLEPAPTELASSDRVPSEPAIDMLALERALDVPDASFDLSVIEQRYPLLRNTL